MSDENYIAMKILKGLSEYLHVAVANHRKGVKGKKKHDYNFKSRVKISESRGVSNSLLIWKWSQDQARYYHAHSMQIIYNNTSLTVNEIGGRRGNKPNWDYIPGFKPFEMSNPDCFDLIANELIRHLSWRG